MMETLTVLDIFYSASKLIHNEASLSVLSGAISEEMAFLINSPVIRTTSLNVNGSSNATRPWASAIGVKLCDNVGKAAYRRCLS